jgi:hypothetical protein
LQEDTVNCNENVLSFTKSALDGSAKSQAKFSPPFNSLLSYCLEGFIQSGVQISVCRHKILFHKSLVFRKLLKAVILADYFNKGMSSTRERALCFIALKFESALKKAFLPILQSQAVRS